MSTCGSSLRHIFESTIQENSSPSSLIDSLSSSWKQIRPIKPHLEHSFTEIFGELHFKENPDPLYSSSSPWKPSSNNGDDHKWWNNNGKEDNEKNGYFQGSSYHKRSDSFSSLNSESLQLCTEGLGSESLDYAEDLKVDFPDTWQYHNKNDDDSNNNDSKNENYRSKSNSINKMEEKVNFRGKRRANGIPLPPPISCIGKTGKPGVSFQSFREDGRFVLKEVKIPTYERLHASREDGRLRLCLIQPTDQEDDGGEDTSEVLDDEDNGDEDEGEEKGAVEKIDEDGGKNKE